MPKPGWVQLRTGETVELARPMTRIGARSLDIILVTAVVLASVGFSADANFPAIGGIALLLPVAYEVLSTAIWGQTLGKRIYRIKVAHEAHGGVPGWGKAFGRWAILSLVSGVPIVGWLLCYGQLTDDRARQGWHDKAAGTLVTKA